MKYKTKQTQTLLETLMEAFKGVSKQKAKQILAHSDFLIDGNSIDKHPQTIIPGGITLEIISKGDEQKTKKIKGKLKVYTIFYEDQYLLAALKPAGLLSCASKYDKVDYSFHKELEHFISQRDEKKTRLFICHRIDREVEGILLFAKTEELQKTVKDSWHEVTKKYLALTENKPKEGSGIIQNWLKDSESRKVKAYFKEVKGSKLAKTEYRYLRQESSYSLVEVTLHTGRKNQIRVHLSDIGCPIVGDRKYGAQATPVRQIRLAAYYIDMTHPVSGKRLEMKYQPDERFFKPSKKEDEHYK